MTSVVRKVLERCALAHLKTITDPHSLIYTQVQSVVSSRFLGVTITRDLKWELNATTLLGKAQKRLVFLRELKKFKLPRTMMAQFHTGIIESTPAHSIITWFSATAARDLRKLQRVIRFTERVIGCPLPSLESLYISRALRRVRRIMAHPSHPGYSLFVRLCSGRRLKPLSN